MRKPRRTTSIEQRFIDRVAFGDDDTLDCWTWTGALTGVGYGLLGVGRRELGLILAHRLSYEMHFDTVVPRHLDVCHRCNNRACVNPAHLYVGTRKDNMRQAQMEGRLKRAYRPWSAERRARHEAKYAK